MTSIGAGRLGSGHRGGIALWIAICGLLPAAASGEEILVDGIAAQVGSEIVLLSEVQEMARPVEERMRAAGVAETEVRAMHADALERLIETKLIEGVVRRLEMEATQAEIDNAVAGIAQDTGLTVEQLHSSVESHGLTIREYRHKLKGEIERSKVLNAMVRSRVRVPPDEVRAAYDERFSEQPQSGDEVHLRHILVGAGEETRRDQRMACAIAEDARGKIVAGEIDFGGMARRVTDMNPEQAGELGWLHVDDIASWMSRAIDRLRPGEVSSVIETGFGCNLLQLVERRSFTPITFEQAEARLTDELSQRAMEKEYVAWLDTLRKQTYVSRKGLYSESGRIERITAGNTDDASAADSPDDDGSP